MLVSNTATFPNIYHECVRLLPVETKKNFTDKKIEILPHKEQISWVRSQHTPTQWYLRGGKQRSVGKSTKENSCANTKNNKILMVLVRQIYSYV
jgi:hypothetical protein